MAAPEYCFPDYQRIVLSTCVYDESSTGEGIWTYVDDPEGKISLGLMINLSQYKHIKT